VGVDQTGAVAGRAQQFLHALGAGVAFNRVQRPAQAPGAFQQPDVLIEQVVDGGVPLSSARGQRRSFGAGCGVPAGGMCDDALLHRRGQVVPQMPPVAGLDCFRGALADGFGVGGRTIAAHDLDTGVLAQPGRQCLALAIGQHVNTAVGDRVDQHGRILASAPDREVVHAEYLHSPDLRIGQCVHQPQQSAPTGRQPQPGRQARTSPARQRQPDALQHTAAQRSPTAVPPGQPVNLLGKRPRRTADRIAEEPPHP
jgi:hypothetical protein